MNCYCNSGKEFEKCCQPFILGKAVAGTAEQLMRSRYSAFALADINYLMNSHYPQTRPTKDRKSILKWAKSVEWLRLEIVSKQGGSTSDNSGYVEFKAHFSEGGIEECIHENSYFVKENGVWYYQSGTHK